MNTGLTATGGRRGRVREAPVATAHAAGRAATAGAVRITGTTTAVLVATAFTDEGDAAALLPAGGTPVVRRLVDQLATLGIRTVHVVTREGWLTGAQAALAGAPVAVEVHPSPALADDLRLLAAIAGRTRGGLVLLAGEVLTHREALAGLLADPRLGSAILVSNGWAGKPFAFRARSVRGRVVSAASPYHDVHRPNTGALGVVKVGPDDVPALAAAADELAALVTPPLPAGWEPTLKAKAGAWRLWLARAAAEEAGRPLDEIPAHDPEAPATAATVPLAPADEDAMRRRTAVAAEDAVALALVGLVRRGAHVGNSYLRGLFWARPLSREDAERAHRDMAAIDEDRILLESAVKANDGFFTTFFVSPYSKYIARWAAHRGLTPNQVTTFALVLGIVAAVLFATGSRAGLVAGAVFVHLSFVFDCVDGQLARYTRTFSKLGAWLDSVFDRAKEYVTFAGLAIGADRAGTDVWVLAGAALALQSVRHTLEFSFGATRHRLIAEVPQPPLEQVPDDAARRARAAAPRQAAAGAPPAAAPEAPVGPVRRVLGLWRALDRVRAVVWVKKMIAFPIGERFAAIAITAALFGPRTTFIVLLAWGGFAALYTTSGRALRSLVR